MGSKNVRGVRFQCYSGDHAGASIPHVHAHFNEGDVDIELLADRSIRLSEQHKADPHVKANDVRKALRAAAAGYDDLLELWENSRPS
ncbi:MAG TPA: DUF4160 domain-containing protein [Candidatus Baltobacteraceae bacterium]|nr:DUF4160 domain-containing protein [Candidatus Baltobacteraceae bacterium]